MKKGKPNVKAVSIDGKYRIVMVFGPCSIVGNDIYCLQKRKWFYWKTVSFTMFYSRIRKWLLKYDFGFDNYFSWLRIKGDK